ncbi:MAG: alpha/beta hydrolase [Alkalibacterium sp.]|nr:alpha/beta hydrolase [Alkalibacterium sp.]
MRSKTLKKPIPLKKSGGLPVIPVGGASAAIYAEENAGELEGLIFVAAYPGEGNDLSGSDLPVLSITGSQDGIMNAEQYEQTKALLPEHTSYIEIEGGNHSNFGYYGYQDGDGASTLSRKKENSLMRRYS